MSYKNQITSGQEQKQRSSRMSNQQIRWGGNKDGTNAILAGRKEKTIYDAHDRNRHYYSGSPTVSGNRTQNTFTEINALVKRCKHLGM